MESIIAFAQSNALMVSTIILICSYIFIATEKIPKVTIAMLGASVTLLLGLLSQNSKIDGVLDKYYFINYVDWNVIFLLVSMMIIVSIATRSGVFNWIAIDILRRTKGHPKTTLFCLALFTAVASAFLDNVTTVILVMPITFIVAEKLDISPIPFLITEIMASNIGGTATLIGDPPNIIIGCAAGLSFMDFIKELTGIVFVIFAVVASLIIFRFRKQLIATDERMNEVANLDNTNTIKDRGLMVRSIFVLAIVILGFITHDVTHIQTSVCAMTGASFLLIFEKPNDILNDVEWGTIFFFIGLFVIIGGFEKAGGIDIMARWLIDVTHGSQTLASMFILWGSGILSGIIDNIPYTATMAPMLEEIAAVKGAAFALPLWWCLSLGACLGGNLTIIGAAANVIVSETAASKGYPIPFMRYMRYGIICTVVSLALSTGYIWLRFLR